MLREQWVHTSRWVHGFAVMSRALRDDTIAACSTPTRMPHVELAREGQLHLGIHDASLERKFDLDIEAPVVRRRGSASSLANTWKCEFVGDANSVAAPSTTKAPKTATLTIIAPTNAPTEGQVASLS